MQAGTYFPSFNTLLASFHAASLAPCSCHSVSSWDRSSNFGALELRWWGSPRQIYPSEGVWSRTLVWRAIIFVNFTLLIGFCISELFRKIDDNFGGSMSWKTQPQLPCIRWTAPNRSVALRVTGVTAGSPRSVVTFVTVDNGLPRSIMQLILLQHGYCTFVIILFGPFTRLFINLTMCIWALFTQTGNHSWSCRTSILEGATFHKMSYCKFL